MARTSIHFTTFRVALGRSGGLGACVSIQYFHRLDSDATIRFSPSLRCNMGLQRSAPFGGLRCECLFTQKEAPLLENNNSLLAWNLACLRQQPREQRRRLFIRLGIPVCYILSQTSHHHRHHHTHTCNDPSTHRFRGDPFGCLATAETAKQELSSFLAAAAAAAAAACLSLCFAAAPQTSSLAPIRF